MSVVIVVGDFWVLWVGNGISHVTVLLVIYFAMNLSQHYWGGFMVLSFESTLININ